MNGQDVMNALNRILDLGDTLDNAGGGVQALTNGSHTTREVCKIELGQFLLYVADGGDSINDGQAAVLNLVFFEGLGQNSGDQYMQLAKTIGTPNPKQNMTLISFRQGDQALSAQNGTQSSSLEDILTSVYEAFGRLMVAFNENAISQQRYDRFMRDFKSSNSSMYSTSSTEEKSTTSKPTTKKTTSPKPKASPAQKKTSTGSKKTSTSSKTKKTASNKGIAVGQYNDLIGFELPEGYRMLWEDKEDGTKECRIVYGEYVDDNGNTAYEFLATVSDMDVENTEDDVIPAGEKPFATMHRRDPERRYISVSDTPEAELQVKETPINILGRQFKVYALALLVQVSDSKLVSVMKINTWDEEDSSENIKSYGHMIVVANALRYNGKALPAISCSAEDLFEQLKPDFEGKESMITGKIGLKITSGDEVISESVLSGDDDGNIHREDDHHGENKLDGKYAGYVIENGGIKGTNKKLTKIDIPDGVTSIDDEAFEGYKSLAEITIPESVTYIGNSAFSGCTKLTKVVIPASVRYINSFAFNECKNLVEVVLPEGIEWIGSYAFSECIKLAKINLPDSLENIYMCAFQGCASLTSITIPDGIDELRGSTFDGCKKLESVSIPDSVTEIGSSVFEDCEKLTKVHIPEDVHTIGNRVFNGCVRLEQVNIPADITEIGDGMFGNCKKLKTITIPTGVTSIGEDAFNGCESLTEVNIPEGVETIGDDAFSACKRIKRITIPSTVKTIGRRAFYQCAALTEVSIPNGILEISDIAFSECTGLKKVILPDSVTSIGDYAFDGCTALKGIILPSSLEKIGDNAFNACKALTEIEIPDSVTSIGDFAFDDCDALKHVSMPGKEVQTGSWAFPNEAEISYRAGNGRITKRKPGASSNSRSRDSSENAMAAPKPSGRYTSVTPSDELYSHYGKLKREADKFKGMGVQYVQNNGEEFQALDMVEILESNGKTGTNVYRKLKDSMKGDNYALDLMALRMSQVFRVNESAFVSRHDDEGDIHETLMDKKWKLSALRSFAWTLADLADREGKSIDDYEYDELVKLCDFIKEREWLNYQDGSWFDGLCGHSDIHVFYMPGKMIESGEAEEICDVLKYDPITSLDAFRDDLSQLKNAMIRLHNGLLKDRDRDVKLDTPASAVLQAWCVMAMAARIPFISEDGPMFFFHSYPKDALNTDPISVGKKSASVKKAAPKAKKEEASSVMTSAANYEIIRGPDGKERVKLGEYPVGSPITWLVLEKNGKDLLLLSEYGLDARPYNSFLESGNSTNEWHDCSLRSWLNDGFYSEAFSTDERAMIIEDTHDTYKKTANGEEATASVKDKVFLLSAREARKYFPQERDLICKATAFAKEQGAEIEADPNQCSWWLRSPAVEMMGLAQWAASIRADGSGKGWGNSAGEVYVRPVIRVKADKISMGEQAVPAAKSTTIKRDSPKKKSAAQKQASDLQENMNEVAATVAESADRPLSKEEREAVQKAQGILNDMQNQLGQTTSALEKHAETLRKQEEEKQKKIEEAKKKGKSSKDETDMLVILLNEEALGQLHRADSEFATVYAEDFGAYDEAQLLRLRKKVLPVIHDAEHIENAKADMLARSVEDRFTLSTGNFFNVSNDWDFDNRSSLAIEKTSLWYDDSELSAVRKLMDAHEEKTRQSVLSQLTGFNAAWGSFSTAKKDLQISIEASGDPIPEAHSLFHVAIQGGIHVSISLSNPSLGFITIPIMNVFASCWKVSPEDIWDAALNNKLNDSRGYAVNSRRDAEAGKAKALSAIKPQAAAQTVQDPGASQQSRPAQQAQKAVASSTQSGSNANKIKELEERIAVLQREYDSIKGLFGFVRKNKIKKEMQELQQELYALRNR